MQDTTPRFITKRLVYLITLAGLSLSRALPKAYAQVPAMPPPEAAVDEDLPVLSTKELEGILKRMISGEMSGEEQERFWLRLNSDPRLMKEWTRLLEGNSAHSR